MGELHPAKVCPQADRWWSCAPLPSSLTSAASLWNHADDKKKQDKNEKAADAQSDLLEDSLKCVICFSLCERPVTVR